MSAAKSEALASLLHGPAPAAAVQWDAAAAAQAEADERKRRIRQVLMLQEQQLRQRRYQQQQQQAVPAQGQAVEVDDGPAPAAAATTSQTVPELPASSAPREAAQSLASLQDEAEVPDWGDPDDSAAQDIPPDTEDEAGAGANGDAQTGVWRQQIPLFGLVGPMWARLGPVWAHWGPSGPVLGPSWARLGPLGRVLGTPLFGPFAPRGAFGPTPLVAHPCWPPPERRGRPRAIRTRRPEVRGETVCLAALLSTAAATSSSSPATGSWRPRSPGSCRIGRPSAPSGTSTQRPSWTRRRRPLLIWTGGREGPTGRVGVASTCLIGGNRFRHTRTKNSDFSGRIWTAVSWFRV